MRTWRKGGTFLVMPDKQRYVYVCVSVYTPLPRSTFAYIHVTPPLLRNFIFTYPSAILFCLITRYPLVLRHAHVSSGTSSGHVLVRSYYPSLPFTMRPMQRRPLRRHTHCEDTPTVKTHPL
ncbi:hypothetical protein POVWA2_034940 [Plasmodium ovale wallikeri]|uniref:Uncharacterized protein n=1 Tax=Plasmodium ovale wallikeri TaxID=864142 RepID=A0A1A8Z0E3_PLAOA|nr:hypothetical protein POVWA1_035680 [Plasmodium ovale wallikeri]SBT38047.1 hypothetical protein POVWA2_034940 [Plasmodium ovale wallikeri]